MLALVRHVRPMMTRPLPLLISRRQMALIACAAAFLPAGLARADGSRLFAPGGVALGGYDPVAYFTGGQAIAGSQDHMLKWHGAIWLFASAENMEAFEMDPASYVPQYGGYCAYGVGEGVAASPDPQVFVVENGRLYLYSSPHSRSEMQSDFPGYVARADRGWQAIAGK